jgi:uncharacterized protein YcbK (DUF882 family)
MNISKNITYYEATKSQTALRNGIENIPSGEDMERMKRVAELCFEPIRAWHGKPLAVSSFFRSYDLNEEIGGSETSDHIKGCAIDIDADVFNNGVTNAEIFQWALENLEFDQLIWEFGNDKNPAWVHISYRTKETNRNQVLKY